MDLDVIGWLQVNWTFSLAFLFLIYAFCNGKSDRKSMRALALFFFIIWGAWRLISNYLLEQWGYSALNAWTLGEIDYGLPNIDLTILGWIYVVLLLLASVGEKDAAPAEKEKKAKKNASIIDSSATISTSEFFETSDDSSSQSIEEKSDKASDDSSSQSIEEKSDKGNKSDNIFDDI